MFIVNSAIPICMDIRPSQSCILLTSQLFKVKRERQPLVQDARAWSLTPKNELRSREPTTKNVLLASNANINWVPETLPTVQTTKSTVSTVIGQLTVIRQPPNPCHWIPLQSWQRPMTKLVVQDVPEGFLQLRKW